MWKSGKGRCTVASRDIEAMELILFDQALVVGPRAITEEVKILQLFWNGTAILIIIISKCFLYCVNDN